MDDLQTAFTEAWAVAGAVVGKVLTPPPSPNLSGGQMDPSKKRMFIPFHGRIADCQFEGAFGVELKGKNPVLFVEGKLTPTILGHDLKVQVLGEFAKDGVVLSGTLTDTITVPVIELQVINPLLVIGLNSGGIPCGGVGGHLAMGEVEVSFVVLLDKDPEKSVFIAAVSKLSVAVIVESIAHTNVPTGIRELLDIVELTYYRGEEFSIPANKVVKLAAALDDKDAKEVSDQIAAVNNKLTLPTTRTDVVLVVREPGSQWSITNLKDERRRHYQLEKGNDGKIQVSVAPQVYCVEKSTRVAGNDFKAGYFVSGRLSILGFGGEAQVTIDKPDMGLGYPRIKLDADLDRLVVKDERLFSITSARNAGKGPHLSFETIKSPDLKLEWPTLGDPHFDLDAKVTLLGVSGETTAKISTRECSFSLRAPVAKVSGSISIVPLKVSAEFGIDIGTIDIPLIPDIDVGEISVGLTITGDGAKLDDVEFSVLGVDFTIPGVDIPIPIGKTLTQLVDVVKDEVIDKIRDYFDPSKDLVRAAEAIADGAEEFFTSGRISFSSGGGNFKDPPNTVGFTIPQIREVVRTKEENEDPALIMEDSSRFVEVQPNSTWFIGQLWVWWKFSPATVAWLAKVGGYSAWEVASGFALMGMPGGAAALLLKSAGFSAQDVGGALRQPVKYFENFKSEVYGRDPASIAKILRNAGYGINSAADFLRSVGGQTAADRVRILREAGYPAATELPVEGAPYLIVSAGGANPRLLGCAPDTSQMRLWDKDDGSGRQLWYFSKVPGTEPRYVISRFRDISPRLLSCAANGSVVDLVYTLDSPPTHRQEWRLTPTGDGSFTIESAGVLSTARKYLSCLPDGSKIDLFDRDDQSGRQQWQLIPWPATDGTEYVIQTLRPQKEGRADTLSNTGDGAKVELSERDGGSAYQRWTFDRVDGIYHVRPAGQLRYLSCLGNGTLVDLFSVDDKSGRQRWKLNPTSPGGVQPWFTIEAAGGLTSPHKYLSYAREGNTLGLWEKEDGSGHQRWRVRQA